MNNKYFKLTVIIIITLILSLFLFAGVKYYGVENFSSCGEECFDDHYEYDEFLDGIYWYYDIDYSEENIIGEGIYGS